MAVNSIDKKKAKKRGHERTMLHNSKIKRHSIKNKQNRAKNLDFLILQVLGRKFNKFY